LAGKAIGCGRGFGLHAARIERTDVRCHRFLAASGVSRIIQKKSWSLLTPAATSACVASNVSSIIIIGKIMGRWSELTFAATGIRLERADARCYENGNEKPRSGEGAGR
jgi:hypothetical protein